MDKIKKKFLFVFTVLAAFLFNNRNPVSAKEINPSEAEPENKKELAAIEKTQEWKELKKRWSDLKNAKGLPGMVLEKGIEGQKEINNKYLLSLAAKGYITRKVAFIVNYAYAEVLFHRLRSASGATCYKVTQLGGATGSARDDLEKRLKVLSSARGAVDENVYKEARDNIARDIEFLRCAQELFDKGRDTQYGQQYWEEEKALAALFKDGKVDESMKAGEDVVKAAELIIKLNADNIKSTLEPAARLEQLKKLNEWGRIKSNWKNIAGIEQAGYDSMTKVIAEKKKENWGLLHKLVGAGLLTEDAARVINDIYADRIYHRLRPMAATCYEPSILGFRQQSVRNDIENRLKELADIAKEGKVKEDVLNQAKRNLEKDMEIVLLINEHWEKGKEPEQNLVSYFTEGGYANSEIKDSLKIREGVRETVEVIQLLYDD